MISILHSTPIFSFVFFIVYFMFVVNVLEMHASSDPEDWMAELVMMRLLIQSLTA